MPSRFGLRYNLGLVIAEVERWPVATILVAPLIAAGMTLNAVEAKYSTVDFAVIFTGSLIGCLGGKAVWLLSSYSLVYRARFPGSYLIAMFIAMIPVFVYFATVFYGFAVDTGKAPPVEVMALFMPFSYVLFSFFFAGAARISEWIQQPK